ncbi:MAG: hypothetical protein JOY82_24065 [Streptosporangiaceae bacterium]|nr:hypothetical protein [Streptosporangiaceae bacterium]MBV9857559.1 hypothetical protein [Streptosporangiaceae bacterium]
MFRINWRHPAVAVAAVLAFAATGAGGMALATVGPAGPVPAAGVQWPGPIPASGVHSRNFCGTQWKNVRPNGGVGYNIYNDDFGARTCLFNDGNAGFVISRSTANGGWVAFPNVSQGWEWGRSARHAPMYPVKMRDDGHPFSAIELHLINSGSWNAAYDMWFSTYPQKNGQDNAAEVMIWLDCRNDCIGSNSPVVRIDGMLFHEISWTTFHNGVSWRYTAFVMVFPHRTFRGWLNPFYRAAGVHPDWYLTSIDFGFELNVGGRGLAVNKYQLGGVR